MSLGKAGKQLATANSSIQSFASVIDSPLDEEEPHGSAERVEDSRTSTSHSSEQLLTSLLFAIPLPNPANDYSSVDIIMRPVILYTLPRSVYDKPPKNPQNRKRAKDPVSKRISRSWNKSIRDGEDIKRGDLESSSVVKRCLGAVFCWTASTLRFITTCDNQILARLPPLKKLGQVQVFFLEDPASLADLSRTQGSKTAISSERAAEEIFINNISQARKETTFRTALAGFILPIALAAEVFVPLVFEISLIYFLVQYKGWKKVKFLLKKYEKEKNRSPPTLNHLESGNAQFTQSTCGIFKFKVIEPSIRQDISKLVQSACSQVDPRKFPVVQDTTIDSVPTSQNGVIKLSTFPLESNSPITLDSNVDKHSSVVNLKDSSRTAQTDNCNNSKMIQLQSNPDKVFKPDTADAIDISSKATDVAENGTKKSVLESPAAGDPYFVDLRLNETQGVGKAQSFSTIAGGNAQNSNTNLPDTPSSLQKKKSSKAVANIEIAAALINIFKDSLPPNVVSRHELNERRVAEDFNRILRGRTKEYVNSVKKSG